MRVSTVIFIIFLLLFIGCEGTPGPQGEQGPGLKVNIITGILPKGDLKSDGSLLGYRYWDINVKRSIEKSVINVHVREGSQNRWKEPLWSFKDDIITIVNDGNTGPGYEYRIAISE